MASTVCPHCGTVSNFSLFPGFPGHEWLKDLIRWVADENLQNWIIGARRPNLDNLINNLDAAFLDKARGERWRLCTCHGCDRPFLGIFDKDNDLIRVLPPAKTEADSSIPDNIRQDFEEALLCLSFGAFKASVAMSRRALEGAAVEKGGDPKKRLVDQLQQLVTLGKLNDSLAQLATLIRLVGNYGAHPQDDGLDEVTNEQAKDISDLTVQVLEDLYVNPARVERLRARSSKPKDTSETTRTDT